MQPTRARPADDHAAAIRTRLNYLAPGQTPVTRVTTPGEPTPRTAAYVKHDVAVHDGRLANGLSLDVEGCELVSEPAGCSDYFDAGHVRTHYYPVVEALVKAHTGAARVVAFDHNVRAGDAAMQARLGVREPVRVVHNDYTVKSGPVRVRDLLPDEAGTLLRRRFAVVNVWRPIAGPVASQPLGVCDASSMAFQDFVTTDLEYGDRTGEVYQVTWNPAHRWYYFSAMQVDEAMLLKCYDSAEDGRARFTAHSAFTHPATTAESPPRQSIETRTLAFF